MNKHTTDLREAQTLVARLARHVATEIDLHYDVIDPAIMAEELNDLQHAIQVLTDANLPVPPVVRHVLVKSGVK